MYLKAKNSLSQQELLALNMYLSSFSKKSDAKIYIVIRRTKTQIHKVISCSKTV